ncbi:5-(carboxyamino)imidazole ribonucleotide synthase [Thiolapillus brandeum]|uniref:N5-carboxyaminoimidazole ribonucleotide synthase n=1 Tax=Thiolapillus brandeum TaxID=1076588 RepID=A0A7U6GJ59_9GAMM|nr:5-(carboxyamino)imidazole ribonucleotide synthase [Thiolapillus brandeum]BAO44562.1 5-(carboxyamino)imidazole ribonucleotide synthase [Thiolapillus brandeum]
MKIGILGGGQLARMLALAGYPLGLDFVVLEPAPDACAAPLAGHIQAAYDDPAALEQLAELVDRVTYEFESVPASAVEQLGESLPVYPPANALATARDRHHEKTLFNELGIETAPFAEVHDLAGLKQGVAQLGLPAILKTRTLGYDGKGQQLIHPGDELEAAWQAVGQVPCILEGLVNFDREVSIIAVRSVSGEMAFYPLAENVHRDGILRLSTCLHEDSHQPLAEDYARRMLEHLGYVGVLAIEFFQVGEHLLANEMAPRVHNSGHWTIEGAHTSQFENHLRAVLDLPLGSTQPLGHAAMVNLIGDLPDTKALLGLENVHLHLYGKAPRPDRKIGHVTVREASVDELQARLSNIDNVLQ